MVGTFSCLICTYVDIVKVIFFFFVFCFDNHQDNVSPTFLMDILLNDFPSNCKQVYVGFNRSI